ncbi:hypothetical protein KJ815_11055, partial [bacterium]|nr:hypothetical protein [bacterium]
MNRTTPPQPSPTPKPATTFVGSFVIADTLLVIAVLILVFRWEKLGVLESGLAVLFGIGAVFFFVKGIRAIFASRKPPKQEEPWKPIE